MEIAPHLRLPGSKPLVLAVLNLKHGSLNDSRGSVEFFPACPKEKGPARPSAIFRVPGYRFSGFFGWSSSGGGTFFGAPMVLVVFTENRLKLERVWL
jgi:hypothetical protein